MVASMSESNVCRLCLDECQKYKNLYNRNGCGNELYEMTYKYFHPTILDMEQAKHLRVICLPCWRHIRDFHNFKLSILVAQAQLMDKSLEDIKVEEISETNATPTLEGVNLDSVKAEPLSKVDDMPQIYQAFTITGISGNVADNRDFICLPELQLTDVKEDNSDQLIKNDPVLLESDVQTEASGIKEETLIVAMIDEPANNQELPNKQDLIEAMPALKTKNKSSYRSEEKSPKAVMCQSSKKKYHKEKINKTEMRAEKLNDLIAKTLSTIKCTCRQVFSKFSLYRQHVLHEHPKRKFSLSCCKRRIFTFGKIEDHFLLHLNPNVFRCEACFKTHKTNGGLRKHYTLTNHAEMRSFIENTCDLCNRCFQTSSTLRQHCLSVHGVLDATKAVIQPDITKCYSCAVCGKINYTLRAYRRHRLHCQPTENICGTCNRSFKFVHDLRSHQVTHKRLLIYNCLFCPRMFTDYGVFLLHRKQVHNCEEINENIDGSQVLTDKSVASA